MLDSVFNKRNIRKIPVLIFFLCIFEILEFDRKILFFDLSDFKRFLHTQISVDQESARYFKITEFVTKKIPGKIRSRSDLYSIYSCIYILY